MLFRLFCLIVLILWLLGRWISTICIGEDLSTKNRAARDRAARIGLKSSNVVQAILPDRADPLASRPVDQHDLYRGGLINKKSGRTRSCGPNRIEIKQCCSGCFA